MQFWVTAELQQLNDSSTIVLGNYSMVFTVHLLSLDTECHFKPLFCGNCYYLIGRKQIFSQKYNFEKLIRPVDKICEFHFTVKSKNSCRLSPGMNQRFCKAAGPCIGQALEEGGLSLKSSSVSHPLALKLLKRASCPVFKSLWICNDTTDIILYKRLSYLLVLY